MRVIKKVVELVVLTSLVIPASAFASGRPSEEQLEPSPYDSQGQVVVRTNQNDDNKKEEEAEEEIAKIYYKSLEDAGDKPGGRSSLPREVVFLIYDFLFPQDWCNLALVSKDMKESLEAYKEDVVNRLANQFDSRFSDAFAAKILSGYIKRNPVLNASFIEKVHKRIEEESYVFVSISSPVTPYLPGNLTTRHIGLSYNDLLKNLKGSSKLYKAFFRKRFPLQNNRLRKSALHHLESIWSPEGFLSYKKRTDDDDGLHQFIQKEKDSVLENYKTGGYRLPYFSLLSDEDDTSQLSWRAHNIVITDEQLGDRNIKQLVEKIFENNPRHILTLRLGKYCISRKGKLRIYGNTLPQTIKHLVLTDPSRRATTIARHFLLKTPIQFLDISGLTAIRTISYACLAEANELKSFVLSDLPYLSEIGDYFMFGCRKLKSLTFSNLPSLQLIKNEFLYECMELNFLKLEYLPKLTSINGFPYPGESRYSTTISYDAFHNIIITTPERGPSLSVPF